MPIGESFTIPNLIIIIIVSKLNSIDLTPSV